MNIFLRAQHERKISRRRRKINFCDFSFIIVLHRRCRGLGGIKSFHQFSGFYRNWNFSQRMLFRFLFLCHFGEWKIARMRYFLQYFINKLFVLFVLSLRRAAGTRCVWAEPWANAFHGTHEKPISHGVDLASPHESSCRFSAIKSLRDKTNHAIIFWFEQLTC